MAAAVEHLRDLASPSTAAALRRILMPKFIATMRVIRVETWDVEAKDEEEARKKFSELAEDVIDDVGEVVDWEVRPLQDEIHFFVPDGHAWRIT
jgi:hypothetical protein